MVTDSGACSRRGAKFNTPFIPAAQIRSKSLLGGYIRNSQNGYAYVVGLDESFSLIQRQYRYRCGTVDLCGVNIETRRYLYASLSKPR